MILIPPDAQCHDCIHYKGVIQPGLGEAGEYIGCAAFSGWIPTPILLNEFDHTEPYPGDNGIRFEPIPEKEV